METKDNFIECDYGCGQLAIYKMNNGKNCCATHYNKCPALRKKNSNGLKKAHKKNPNMTAHIKKGSMQGWDKFSEYEKKALHEKSASTLKKRYDDGILESHFKGETHSLEARIKMSKKKQEKNHGGKCQFFDYNGIKL